jgi:adenylate cyclase
MSSTGDLSEQRTAARARSALLAFVRHELLTPVNAILGFSEMLIEDAAALGREDVIPDLRKLHASGKLLLKLIGDVVDGAKLPDAHSLDLAAFAARVSHELRTPINAVIGYSELLTEDASALGDAFVADLLKIREAGQKLLALFDDLVNFPRADSSVSNEASPASHIAQEVVRALYVRDERIDEGATREGGRLLIVDDNKLNRDVLKGRLQRQGHSVEVAEGGEQAMRMLAGQQFDLLLLDIMMPGMNGLQVLQRLKSDDRLRAIPVIVVSALGEMDSIVRCIELGAEDYLPKPCDLVLLRARVAACLEQKRLRDKELIYLEQLRVEREKSERLLLNVLPRAIAERLREGPSFIAERFEEATVIFADLVGFTQWADGIAPDELVRQLNDLFSGFDRLTEHLGLEKIKTIGDCYMAAGGLPQPRPDHAETVAELALDMQDELRRFNRRCATSLDIRIGIHTGPVVAGIIGTRKFIYDLWGDTVNIASRMESHSVPGLIQVTGETYTRLREKYDLSRRGPIQVRGKGTMTTYFLTGRKTNPSPRVSAGLHTPPQ